MKREKGITLIALVITIVILIILAGVAINLTIGENGIFSKAKYASEQYANEQAKEETEIAKMPNEIDSHVEGNRETVTISKTEYEKLLNSSNANNYSTDEKIIGTWIDGKPLYQKTVTVNCGANGSTWYYENHNIANIADIADYSFSVKNTGGWYYCIGSGANSSNGYITNGFSLHVSTTQVTIFNNISNLYNQPIRLTVCYTKTTD